MKQFIFIVFAMCWCRLQAQELFVFSEPASNMPAHSVAAKLTARYPVAPGGIASQRYMPEVMAGINKQLMLHGSITCSDIYSSALRWESAKVYGKWRFYSNDGVHRHFRLAAYAEGAYTRNPFRYDVLNLDGDHSGVQAGFIATQLLNKMAISATTGITSVSGSGMPDAIHKIKDANALNYTISAGYLVLPRKYTSYRQTNFNVYLELTGMKGLQHGGYMVDVAPALQVIINSNLKINAGYQIQVAGNMLRMANRTLLIGFERTFLGVLKPKRKPVIQ